MCIEIPVHAVCGGKDPLVRDDGATTERSVFHLGDDCNLPRVLVLDSSIAAHYSGDTVAYTTHCGHDEEST